MNIFYLHNEPKECARQHCDKHVVKMIVETAQLLSTAHRVLDGVRYEDRTKNNRRIHRWKLPDFRDSSMYKASHIEHPSNQWTRSSSANYYWLHGLLVGLICEYEHRYKRTHKTEEVVDLLNVLPDNIHYGGFNEPTPAMPDKYKVKGNSIQSYRNYYIGEKQFATWTNRDTPEWYLKHDLILQSEMEEYSINR